MRSKTLAIEKGDTVEDIDTEVRTYLHGGSFGEHKEVLSIEIIQRLKKADQAP